MKAAPRDAPSPGGRARGQGRGPRAHRRRGLWPWRFAPFALALPVLLLTHSSAFAQATPRIGYVYPAGARIGTATQVFVGGQFLDGVTNAYVTGEGLSAVVLDFTKPMNPGLFNQLRDQLRELQEKKQAAERAGRRRFGPGNATTNTWTDDDEKKLADLRQRLLKNPPNRNAAPAIAEVATLRLTVASNAPPGPRELRLGTPAGLSNPLTFHVGTLPEFAGPPARAANPELDRLRERFGRVAQAATPKTEPRLWLPSVVNGQIMPGEVDRYRFTARRGQRLVAVVRARALLPYLADAVPGWFQATVALLDASGREVSYADDFRFDPDPALSCVIPQDGEYVLEIKDAIYRGREDFVYRLTVGELPFVTSAFPLGGQVGTPTEVELAGWNLPQVRLTVTPETPGCLALPTRGDWPAGSAVLFCADELPQALEREPNDQPASAQPLTQPAVMHGRIGQPGDVDVFRVEGRAGDVLVAEVQARRLNSPLDSRLRLTDAAGGQLALNDDHDDQGAGLTTHQADSYLRATLPKDGRYFLHLGDAQRNGGPAHAYRLRVSPPQPDFALRVVPATLNVRAGATVPLTVFALRQDGFSNAIALTLQNAPRGFVLGGARVPAGQDQVRLTLTAPSFAPGAPLSLQLEGRARLGAREITRRAVPAEDLMQAFAYRHLVPAQAWVVAVTPGFGQRGGARLVSETPVRIPAGGTARVCFDAPGRAFLDRVQLELSEPPDGVTIKSIGPAREGTEIVLQCDAEKARAGLSGNLIVSAFAAPRQEGGKGQALRRRASLGSLPAIPFEIVGR